MADRDILPRPPFLSEVQHALRNLYNAAELGNSPLVRWLRLEELNGPAASLRRLLIEEIEGLKPGLDTPPQARDWRLYRILYHRYVEQFPQKQVAANLSLSVRQLRREEAQAVHALAQRLIARYGLAIELEETPEEGWDDEADVPSPSISSREQELVWASKSFPRELVEVGEILTGALQTIAPLLEAAQVRVRCQPLKNLPSLAVQPDSIRQAILNVLTVAIGAVPGGWIDLEVRPYPQEIQIILVAKGAQLHLPPLGREALESLEMARELVGLSHGSLALGERRNEQDPLMVTITLPAAAKEIVLAVDDNADTLRLLERCLAGTRYALVCARDAEEALNLATTASPRLILLDLMLPGVDGWRLLGRLREHPQTHGIPVVVCSILPQESLALALGAAAFMRKPITREVLLQMLQHQLGSAPSVVR